MKIIKLNATDSTNTYLADLAKNSMLQDEVVVVAKSQEKGRGQRDAVWQSQPSKSLTFSVFKRLDDVLLQKQFAISMLVSIAVASYLKSITATVIDVKWPNDIMAEGKKCGGILIENQVRGASIITTIVGIGLNVNEENFTNLPQATSLHLISGKEYELDSILMSITSEIFKTLNLLNNTTLLAIQKQYEQLLFKKDVLSQYRLPDGTELAGVIKGVSPEGQLLMELPDGDVLKFWNKEIEMVY